MGLSENVGYIPNEIAIFKNGIRVSLTIGFRGLAYFQTHPNHGYSHGYSHLILTSWHHLFLSECNNWRPQVQMLSWRETPLMFGFSMFLPKQLPFGKFT